MTGKNIFTSTSKQLGVVVQKALTAYRAGQQAVHVAAVQCIHHAALHGQPAPLNMLQRGLNSNDRTALRQYLRRIGIATGLGLKDGNIPETNTAEANTAAYEKGQVFTFSETNGYKVISNSDNPNVKKNKETLVKLCETVLLDPPKGSGFTRFLDRNNFAERRILGDAEAIVELKRIVNKYVEGPNSDRTEIKLTNNKLIKFLNGAKDTLESIGENIGFDDEEQRRAPVRKTETPAVTARLKTRGEAKKETVLIQ